MYIVKINCKDTPGIVAAVANCLHDNGCNIEESAQYNDPLSGHFFMRVVFSTETEADKDNFKNCFSYIAEKYDMTWEVYCKADKVPALILTSQVEHCLNDILYRVRTNSLNIDVKAVISNHECSKELVEHHNIPFHYLPVSEDTKAEQEAQIHRIAQDVGAELIVLARYMQILSSEMCRAYPGRAINIHHSFLPGFKGAKPYHQAYERGVKIIGATAHFVTPDLDEGPIIAQEVTPVTHAYTPRKLQSLGRDNEAKTLSRALDLYAERRIFLYQDRTIIL